MPMTTDPLVAVRRHASDLTLDKQKRDIAIKWAHLSGASFRDIAEAAGMTHQGVRKIVKKSIDNSVEGSTIEV